MSVLDKVEVALNDWLHSYAPEFCNDKDVEETKTRILEAGGTLAYIADTLEQVREVKKILVGSYIKANSTSAYGPEHVLVVPPL